MQMSSCLLMHQSLFTFTAWAKLKAIAGFSGISLGYQGKVSDMNTLVDSL